MDLDRLQAQVEFLVEADKLKQIMRNTLLIDATRVENDAEHSWHMALAAMVLAEYANAKDLNMLRVMKLAIIHDIVEIDAGDTFAYDDAAHLDKAEREQLAADRIFGLLPDELREEFRGLWDEYEDRSTPESQFANAIDCFMPLLHNYRTQGRQWRKHDIDSGRVLARNHKRIEDGSQVLGDYIKELVEDGVLKGYLRR